MPAASWQTRPAPSLPARIIGYLFVVGVCLAGPLLLLVAAITGIQRVLFLHSSRAADGVVLAFHEIRPSTNTSYAPVFRFTTDDGAIHSVTSDIAQRPSPWRSGEHVRVLYDPHRAEDAHIDSLAQLWEPQIVVGVVGAGFSTVPLLIFFRRRADLERSQRKRRPNV